MCLKLVLYGIRVLAGRVVLLTSSSVFMNLNLSIVRTFGRGYGGQFILQRWTELSKLCKDNININITSTELKHYKQTYSNNLQVSQWG